MMSSQNAVIRTEYGAYDVPYPVLNCPVVFMARVLSYANHGGRLRDVTEQVISEATQVADLIERLSEPVDYVDFTVHDGYQVLALRMRYVERAAGVVLAIDFCRSPVLANRQAMTAGATSGMMRQSVSVS